MSMFELSRILVVVTSFIVTSANAAIVVKVEDAGVQETTFKLSYAAVEAFDTVKPSDYEGLDAEFGGGKISGSYDIVGVREAGEYGGAGGEGNYLTVDKVATLVLTGLPANYFGLWASALNGGETLAFYRKDELVDEFAFDTLKLSKDYYGNPTKIFAGTNREEAFAFVNFFVRGGFDSVLLSQREGGRFESDVHTVGVYDDVSVIPEPATWITMVSGLAMVGVRRRRRRGAILIQSAT